VDWPRFGVVVPVLAGSSGAGASTFAAAAVDVLQQVGRCALLVDTAEPARSGLGAAATAAGADAIDLAAGVRVRWSWRGMSVLAQLETDLPASTPAPDPAVEQWLPPSGLSPLHVTVVDLGREWSAPTRAQLGGVSDWLAIDADRSAGPYPVLVVRPTRPSLLAAEAALTQLEPWITFGRTTASARLVVMASPRRKWPKHVLGAAGARVAALAQDAVFVPYDDELLVSGVEPHPVPPRVQDAVAGVLDDWGLLAPPHRSHRIESGERRTGRGSPLYLPAD
jgi:hypothetical protein